MVLNLNLEGQSSLILTCRIYDMSESKAMEKKEENKAEEKVEKKEEEEDVNEEGVKKKISYTYWVDDKNKSRELPVENRPKKIEAPVQPAAKPAGNAPSTWNSLGSWEESTISTKELNQVVSDSLTIWLAQKQSQLILTEVELEGEFKRIFSNKKQKVLYDITGKVKFEGDDLHMKLEDFTCTGDQEYSVKGKKKEEREKLQAVGGKLAAVIVETFNRYKQ